MKSLAVLALVTLAVIPRQAHAQLDPSDHWKTIETTHFRVHFPRGLETEANRAAVSGERAFAELSTELKPPKGKVDLVVADNIDYVNGYATSFPSNRIVVFAHPPIDAPELRNYDDWLRLVITHELTHIFHLDRADGLWRIGRDIFGRHPSLFPNNYLPSWVVEGLAVYYESRITGVGRLEGAEHYMIARAAAEAHRLPRIDELSRVTSRFPGGEVVYSYGGLILDYLSRTRGPDKIGKFVDETSKDVFPLSLNAKAKRAFGISFENAWRDWRDSMQRVSSTSKPLPTWRQLTRDGRSIGFPRWLGDTAILYSAANGREVTSVYSVDLNGRVRRLSRRNTLDANVVAPDGSIYYTQPDYTDPFQFRNDLYVDREGKTTRLTKGARLTEPDVSRTGELVAVRAVPGTTILVRVSANGESIVPLTAPSLDVQWADPRWSPDGRMIAAIRVARGNGSQLVLVDGRTGAIARSLVSENAIVASPSWRNDGSSIAYTSTRSGIPQAYAVSVSDAATVTELTSTSTGFFNPEISPDSRFVAGLDFRYDGYHVGYADAGQAATTSIPPVTGPRAQCTNCRLSTVVSQPLLEADVPAAHSYSPWRSLIPTYWEPVITSTSGSGTALGAATSGEDIVGRHSYYAQAAYDIDHRDGEGFFAYRYAGFGQPFVDASAEQVFDHFDVTSRATGARVANLDRRIRTIGLSTTFVRPRIRTYTSFVIGADVESRSYSTDPDTILSHLDDIFQKTRNYPSVVASASWGNTKRPSLSISREDGISLSASARERWQSGDFSTESRSLVGVTALYKSLNLPGFAHHVIALRAAGGIEDSRAISTFNVGGLSGGSFESIAGFSGGGTRRTFGVRGFPPSAEQGIRALAGTAEYRAPISQPSRRVPFIPVLFDKISLAAFSDAGRAFCPASESEAPACAFSDPHSPWLASAGAEVDFDTAVQYDIPVRFRLGFAAPVLNRNAGNAKAASVYFTAGSAF